MKLSLTSALATALLLPFASAHSNLLECATSETTDTDLFPHKVSPEYSEHWDISYHGTYKILTNKFGDESYLLYQCGTEPPAGAEETHTNIISIPPQAQNGVNIASTPMIAYLELLGLRTDIAGYIGSEQLVSSPCLRELIDSGRVIVASSSDNSTILEAKNFPTDAVTLVNGWWTGELNPENTIVMQEYEESSYAGTMEWIKAYAAIFNVEDKANEVFKEATCRFEAIESNVATATADMQARPTVLWAYYSDYCGGWDVAECPNYYCDFADACDAEILTSTEGSAGLELCGVPYMTTEEFIEFGRDADHWIYPSSNWNEVYANNEEILNQFASVRNRTVFDYQGQGSNAWFEQRFAEYDVVLNDFCLVAGTVQSTLPANRRVWLRNVFNDPVGSLETCVDPSAALEPLGNAWSDCEADHDEQHEGMIDVEENGENLEDHEDGDEDHSGHNHADGEHHDDGQSTTTEGGDDSESASPGVCSSVSPYFITVVAVTLVGLYL